MNNISIDLETYSDQDIASCGVYKYADSPNFRILLFAYSVDGSEVQVVDVGCGEQIPKHVLEALSDPTVTKWAYNAAFERVCLSKFLGLPCGTYLNPKGWKCSMVWGATLGLPLGLGKIGKVLNLEEQKLTVGKKLIKLFCTPDSDGSQVPPGSIPEDWDLFKQYNKRDVETEMAVQKKLSAFPVPEFVWEEYWLDQRINDNGVLIDDALVKGAITIDAEIHERLSAKLTALTGVSNPASVYQLKYYLESRGVKLPDLGKLAVTECLEGESLPTDVKEVLTLRQQFAKSSVKKYQAMARSKCSDGRCRGMFQFYGASRTGRWAGRNIQLQNLPQNHIDDLESARVAIKTADADFLSMCYDSPLDVLSQCIRTAFVARKGTRFVVADFSAIEARVIAWYAREEWRLKVFAEGGDIYCAAASAMFHVPVKKHGINGHLRQKGKVAELACGYGGGVGALTAMGALRMGVPEEELQPLVTAWRASSPHIVEFWWAVDRAVRKAIEGVPNSTHGLGFHRTGGFLFITLPSGRRLAYPKPSIRDNRIHYWGTAQAWCEVDSYGPKFVENIVQATSRDLLCNAMRQVGNAKIEMHIHDELVIEAEDDTQLEDICKKMAINPSWAEDLLLRADGYETPFYKKD